MSSIDLPEGWAAATLDEFTQSRGSSVDPAKFLREAFELYSVPSYETGAPERVSGSEIGSAKQAVDPGSVLLCKINPRINRSWMVGEHKGVRQIASTEWIVFPRANALRPDFLRLYLRQNSIRDFLAQNVSGVGGSLMRVKASTLKGFPVPVPPLKEQSRIVEKIEVLFAELDKGEESLRAVQKLLERYRQSVLKAAVTGQLTADWRAENAHRHEEGRELQNRILRGRRETWEGRGKYKEPNTPSLSGLPVLPDGWVWTSLGALISSGPQNGVYLPQGKYGAGVPILRIDDYQVDWLRGRDQLRMVDADAPDRVRFSLGAGDFVVNRVNSVSHLGKSLLVPNGYEGILFESNMMRFSVTDEVSKEYLALYLTSELGRKRLIQNCKHAVNQASINQGDVAATPVPLPPLAEQRVIALKVAEEVSRETASKVICETELARSAALRQSILKDAFAGRLVPQDPDDEPAAELLARIRAERATEAPKPRRKTARQSA